MKDVRGIFFFGIFFVELERVVRVRYVLKGRRREEGRREGGNEREGEWDKGLSD